MVYVTYATQVQSLRKPSSISALFHIFPHSIAALETKADACTPRLCEEAKLRKLVRFMEMRMRKPVPWLGVLRTRITQIAAPMIHVNPDVLTGSCNLFLQQNGTHAEFKALSVPGDIKKDAAVPGIFAISQTPT